MAKILIVDDQKSVLLTLEALLGSQGYIVVASTNAVDALHHLAAEPFDLVITDAIMPGGGDGYALTRTIRKKTQLAKLPVILLTGKRERSDVEKGIEAGVNDYVVKPIDPELLLAKIRNLLATSKGGIANEDAQNEAQFLEAPVTVKAEWETKTEVIGVSELGLSLTSNISVPTGKIMRINSTIFAEIGIEKLPLRVVSCEALSAEEGTYKIQVQFVGLTERELTPLRLWIRSKKTF